jgi:hypothetical protein
MSGGVKYDQNKAPMDLLPNEALMQISRVLDMGAKKYGRYNWRKGMDWSRVISASMRHLTAFNDGEDIDPESGISHVAHAACNLMFLLTYIVEHPELDNRYDKEQKQERSGRTTGSIESIEESNQELKATGSESG